MNHQEELLRAFKINVEDLAVNRLGQLGPAQKRNLVKSGNANIAAALFIGVLLAAILYGVANKPLAPIQWIVALILFAAVMGTGMNYSLQARRAVADGRVECLTGPITIRSRGRAGWFLTVAGRSFHLPIRPWQVQQDMVFRVYIVPKMRTIVGIDPAPNG